MKVIGKAAAVSAALIWASGAFAANIVWDGTTDSNWTNGPQDNSGGGFPANGSTGANWTVDANPPGGLAVPDATTPGGNMIDYQFTGHAWTINGATISEDVQIKLAGGSLGISNSTVSLLPSSANAGAAGLSGLNLGQGGVGTAATLTNSTLNASRSNFGGRALGLIGNSSLNLVNSDINLSAESGLGLLDINATSTLTLDANSSITATGGIEVRSPNALLTIAGGTIVADNMRANVSGGTANDLVIDFQGGSVTVTSANPFRGTAFEGSFNWTGGAGSGSVVATDISNTGSNLAKKVSQGFFSINGTRINPTADSAVDGLAALQAELATLTVGGLWFDLSESGGQQTLTLVPEPASLALIGLGGLVMIRRRR